jgi:hypothetical protein
VGFDEVACAPFDRFQGVWEFSFGF